MNERVYERAGDSWSLQTYTASTWAWSPLFGGKTYFVHPVTSLTRTCSQGASDAACMHQADPVRRTTETWEGITPPGMSSVALYVRSASGEGARLAPGHLDRRALFTYQVSYGQSTFAADDYRILVTETVDQAARPDEPGAQFEPRGRIRTVYDAYGLPVETDEWADADTKAITRRTFDTATGNLLSLTQPAQAAPGGSGARTTYGYDPQRLFVQATTDELGHMVSTTHDLATGALLERAGPNSVTLSNGTRVRERETWQIDGLGRTVAHAVSFDDPAGGYVLHTVQRTFYFDSELPTGSAPSSYVISAVASGSPATPRSTASDGSSPTSRPFPPAKRRSRATAMTATARWRPSPHRTRAWTTAPRSGLSMATTGWDG